MSNNSFGNNAVSANLTAGFIDLATYDELEKYMYGGPDATAYFVRETRKSTWFTQCPVSLSRSNGTPEFGSEFSCSISRAGDYLLGTWLHVVTPEVSLALDQDAAKNSLCIAWTPNFMHALVKECSISFNDLVAARFDGTHLDFWAAFTTPASKSEGYRQMIGAQLPTHGSYIPSYSLNLPLPFFYTRDSGVALPTAALPYNEMRINFTFRAWQEMLMTFREYANCSEGHHSPAMAVEHPQTQVLQGGNVVARRQTLTLATAALTAPTPAQINQGVQNGSMHIKVLVGGNVRASGRVVDASDGSGGAYTGAIGDELVVQLDLDSPELFSGGYTSWRFTDASQGLNDVPGAGGGQFNASNVITIPEDATNGFTQLASQTGVSRPNYAAPYFCRRNCPVVSVAADQLTVGAAVNGFEVDNDGNVVQGGNLGGTNVNAGNSNQLGIFNDQYAHMNYDAEVCSKCLMLGGQDTGLFSANLVKTPSLGGNAVQVWANYAIVSNEERKRMACAPRDILIEQVQSSPTANFGGQNPFPVSHSNSITSAQQYDIRFSHAVKCVFFGAKNTTFRTVHSNYSTGIPCLSKEDCGGCLSIQALAGSGYGGQNGDQLLFALGLSNGPNSYTNSSGADASNPQGTSLQTAGSGSGAFANNAHPVCDIVSVNTNVVGCCNPQDPMQNASLIYENTQRLGLMSSDYYSQVQPYYHAPTIPSKSGPVFAPQGYHMYSYSLDFTCLDPLGSTNFGKLTNVGISATPSQNWGRSACVSNESLQVLYDKNGNNLPQNFLTGRGGLKSGLLANNGVSIEDLLLANLGDSNGQTVAVQQVQGGLDLIDTKRSTQKFSFQFVCTAVNNNIVRISGGALGFPVL